MVHWRITSALLPGIRCWNPSPRPLPVPPCWTRKRRIFPHRCAASGSRPTGFSICCWSMAGSSAMPMRLLCKAVMPSVVLVVCLLSLWWKQRVAVFVPGIAIPVTPAMPCTPFLSVARCMTCSMPTNTRSALSATSAM